MKHCKDCEYFRIVQEPLPDHMDTGMARCEKHDLVTDFYNHGKLKRLTCIEAEGSEE